MLTRAVAGNTVCSCCTLCTSYAVRSALSAATEFLVLLYILNHFTNEAEYGSVGSKMFWH